MRDYRHGRNSYGKYRRVRLHSVGFVSLENRLDHLEGRRETGTKSDRSLLNSYATYSVISAANDMTNICGTRSAMPAFVIVLFSHLRLCIVVEVRRT